jgi:hypothetical protein
MVPEEVQHTLIKASCFLFRNQEECIGFKNEICAGELATKWESRSIGALSGYLFKARVEHENGDYVVSFLLNESDLTRGASMRDEDICITGTLSPVPKEHREEILFALDADGVSSTRH